jgi:DNA-binding transcriptional LysR family regulator
MFEKLFEERGLSLDRLRCIIEVSNAGSIAKAADGDPVRQSLYSRQIKELETYFGCELTIRKGRCIELTDEGNELVKIVIDKFTALEEFRLDCKDSNKEILIAAGDSIILWLLIPALQKIQKNFPNIVFRTKNLRSKDVNKGLQDLTIDFGILKSDSILKPAKSANIIVQKYSIFFSKDIVPKNKLKDVDWVLSQVPIALQSGTNFEDLLRYSYLERGVKINIKLYCESFPQAFSAMQTGCYAAVLPQYAEPFIDNKRFGSIKIDELKEDKNMALAWNPRLLKIRPFMSSIKDQLIPLLQ